MQSEYHYKMADTTGALSLRKEYVDSAVKAVALANYRLKPLCQIDSSSANLESYYRETNSELTGGTGQNVKQIPRLAAFPYGEVSWTKIGSWIDKYGMEGIISYEDEKTNNIPMIQRTVLRIGRAVSYAIDVQIEALLNSDAGNSLALTAGYEWDSATLANRDPVQDLLNAMQTIRADNIDPLNNGYLVVNGTDYSNIIGNSKVTNNFSFKNASTIENGKVGSLCGLTIVVSEAVTADQAYVVVAGDGALIWKQAQPLTVVQIEDPGIKTTIRAFELGTVQLTSPNNVCKITNTRK